MLTENGTDTIDLSYVIDGWGGREPRQVPPMPSVGLLLVGVQLFDGPFYRGERLGLRGFGAAAEFV